MSDIGIDQQPADRSVDQGGQAQSVGVIPPGAALLTLPLSLSPPAIAVKQGDSGQRLDFALSDAGGLVDLSNAAAIYFHAKGLTLTLDALGVVVMGAVGRVRYTLLEGDTDVAGLHNQMDVLVIYSDGSQATFPSDSYGDFSILPEIGSEL